MGYRAGPWTGHCRQRQEIHALRRTAYRTVLGPTEPSVQWIQGHLSPAVKMPGRKTDHSSLSTDEVKNEWIPTTTSQVCYLDAHRNNFYLLSFTFGGPR